MSEVPEPEPEITEEPEPETEPETEQETEPEIIIDPENSGESSGDLVTENPFDEINFSTVMADITEENFEGSSDQDDLGTTIETFPDQATTKKVANNLIFKISNRKKETQIYEISSCQI